MRSISPRFALVIAVQCLATALWGQIAYPVDFSPHGPGGGGYMYSPSISPFDPSHLYVVCDMGGVYGSQDAAQHWQMQDSRQLVSTDSLTPSSRLAGLAMLYC